MGEQSLFGPSASAVQDQLLQQDAAFGNNLTPTGLATAIGGSAGRHIGNIMGLEDPRVAKAQAMKQVSEELRAEGLDSTKPDEFYPKLIRKLNEKGLTEEAMRVADSYHKQAMEGSLKSSQIAEHLAKARAAGHEKLSPLGKLQSEYAEAVAKGDFERAKELKKAIGLEVQGKLEKITEGVPNKGKDWVRDVYKDSYGNTVITGEPYQKSPMVSIDQKAEGTEATKTAELAVDKAKEFEKKVVIASELKPTIAKMEALINNKSIITGGYEALKMGMARFVKIPLGEDPSQVADSQIYDALVNNVILPQIRLFAPVSDYDIENLKKIYGDRKLEPEAIKQILQFAREKIQDTLDRNERLGKFMRNKGKYSEWNFIEGRPYGEEAETPSPASSSNPSSPSASPTSPQQFDRQRLQRLYPGKSPEWYAEQERKIKQRMAQ